MTCVLHGDFFIASSSYSKGQRPYTAEHPEVPAQ
jgi:hypothetical protein